MSEQKAVILGEAPPLEDLLRGLVSRPPFDFESFSKFAKASYFIEGIDFWLEVEKFKKSTLPDDYVSEARRLEQEYVLTSAPRQVNLASKLRMATEARITAGVECVVAGGAVDMAVFDDAQAEILLMMQRDQYVTYINRVAVERNIVIAKLEALWWRKVPGLTLRQFFTFPSPVNAAESRLHNACTCFLIVGGLALAYWADFIWVLVYLLYGFLARVACGPRLDPQAFLVLFVLRPLATDTFRVLTSKFVPSPPKHFAQLCGAVFSAMLLGFAAGGVWIGAVVVAAVFLFASGLSGFVDLCIACMMYKYAAEKGWLGEEACKDCKLMYIAEDEINKARAGDRSSRLFAASSSGGSGGSGGGGTVPHQSFASTGGVLGRRFSSNVPSGTGSSSNSGGNDAAAAADKEEAGMSDTETSSECKEGPMPTPLATDAAATLAADMETETPPVPAV